MTKHIFSLECLVYMPLWPQKQVPVLSLLKVRQLVWQGRIEQLQNLVKLTTTSTQWCGRLAGTGHLHPCTSWHSPVSVAVCQHWSLAVSDVYMFVSSLSAVFNGQSGDITWPMDVWIAICGVSQQEIDWKSIVVIKPLFRPNWLISLVLETIQHISHIILPFVFLITQIFYTQ